MGFVFIVLPENNSIMIKYYSKYLSYKMRILYYL